MSRAYRIRVSESVERVIHVEDGVATTLEILPVLPKERMQALLAVELAAIGMEIDEGKGVARRVVKSNDGAVVTEVELATGVVTVRVENAREVRAEIDEERRVYEERKEAETARLTAEAKKRLEREIEKATEATRRAATARLEGELREVRGELDQVIHRVTAAALKERAAQIGEIEEMAEDAEAGTLTIKVRV